MSESTHSELSIEKIVEMTKLTTNGESFTVIRKTGDYKIGIIVAIQTDCPPSFSIEVLLRVFESYSTIPPNSLEKATGIFRLLVEREYSVAHEDDGWFCCRKSLKAEQLNEECSLIQIILEDYYGDNGD